MIPIKIQIKNFVSYGAEPQIIDFTPYNLICLSGKNGHGKSALLDAITWAVWGQARKTSSTPKADEGLLRLGQTNMMVSLDFVSNNISYRVKREYSVYGRKAQALLEFGILEEDLSTIKPLTHKTIRETQEAIENAIGLDYDTFVNSAFLRQGQSNEFSKKSPKERKEILASILGLNHYEVLRKSASEKARAASAEKDFALKLCNNLESIIKDQPQIEQTLHQTKQKLADCIKKEAEFNESVKLVKTKIEEIYKFKTDLEHEKNFLKNLDEQINELCIELKKESDQWRLIFHRQKENFNQEDLQKQYDFAKNQLSSIRENSQKYLSLKDEIYKKRELLDQLSQNLKQRYETDLEKIRIQEQEEQKITSKLEQQNHELTRQIEYQQHEFNILENQLKNITYSTENHIEIHQKILKIKKEHDKRKGYYYTCDTRLKALQLDEINLKEQIKTANDKDPYCSLCGQNVSSDYRAKLLSSTQNRLAFIQKRKHRLTNILESLKNKVSEYQNQISEFESKSQMVSAQLAKKEELEKQLNKIGTLIKDIESQKAQNFEHLKLKKECLFQLEKQKSALQKLTDISNNPEFKDLKSEMTLLEERIKTILYNPEQEQRLLIELENIQKKYQEHNDLISQATLQEQRKRKVSELVLKIKKLKKLKKDSSDKKNALEAKCLVLTELERQINLVECELTKNNDIKEQLILNKGALEQQLKALAQSSLELAEKRKKIAVLEKVCNDYSVLTAAFSKDGIPALLIEDALPEIEHEANYLLSKLTDNQAQLSLESLRDLRGGGTKETLEIKISDSMGIRPYELFSGGEAFRIDFSLRIALSKLLAKRAGTTLQTLIIDEGFGSQDEEGLSHILEVIHKIQEDFCKIIIVSHLPSMKEQFPVNFLIHKSPQGSLIKVLQQG